jgi:hypothetical protein
MLPNGSIWIPGSSVSGAEWLAKAAIKKTYKGKET